MTEPLPPGSGPESCTRWDRVAARAPRFILIFVISLPILTILGLVAGSGLITGVRQTVFGLGLVALSLVLAWMGSARCRPSADTTLGPRYTALPLVIRQRRVLFKGWGWIAIYTIFWGLGLSMLAGMLFPLDSAPPWAWSASLILPPVLALLSSFTTANSSRP